MTHRRMWISLECLMFSWSEFFTQDHKSNFLSRDMSSSWTKCIFFYIIGEASCSRRMLRTWTRLPTCRKRYGNKRIRNYFRWTTDRGCWKCWDWSFLWDAVWKLVEGPLSSMFSHLLVRLHEHICLLLLSESCSVISCSLKDFLLLLCAASRSQLASVI